MNLFYERTETDESISLTLNRHTMYYVVLSAWGAWLGNKYLSSTIFGSALGLNWFVALIIALVWGVKFFGLRKDFMALRDKNNYTTSGNTLSFKNPLTYHIRKVNVPDES